MAERIQYHGTALTIHSPAAPWLWGRPVMEWLKLYGLFTGLFLAVVLVYTKQLRLFEEIGSKPTEYKAFVVWFAGLPLLLALPAVLSFYWWAGGALTNYAKWQKVQPTLWRWFWFVILVFYSYVLFDPLDSILPELSRRGMAPAPNLLLLFDGKLEWFQFQWGFHLLWVLFWFLILVLHLEHLAEGWRVTWHFTKRFHRYGASVLTGFRETAKVGLSEPVTLDYPRERAVLPPTFRGVPRLNVARLTAEQAAELIAADQSGALTSAPGQPTVLFVDLGRFCYSPSLGDILGNDGRPLLRFDGVWAAPTGGRAELVVPLKPLTDAEASLGEGGGGA